MKVLGNLPVEKDNNSVYPFNANIQNETDVVAGTPVVREIYGDILMNLYKALELTGITPTNTEDNDSTQYQLIEALKKLPNSLNDIEQVLTLSGSVWSVPFDLAYLPNKYVFFGRATNAYNSAITYTFKGSGVTELPFTSPSGFNASDEVMVVIDTTSVRAYSITQITTSPETLSLLIQSPVRFSVGSDLYFFDSGKLYKNLQIWDLQNSIRVDQSDGTLILKTCGFMQGYVVCVVFNPATSNYEFYCFDLLDLATVIPLSSNADQTIGVDLEPEFYFSDSVIYATNYANLETDDYKIVGLILDIDNETLNYSGDVFFDVSFVKTSNGAIYSNKLYTFESNNLVKFDVNTGVKIDLGTLPIIDGYLFFLKDSLYIGTGNIAHKLNV